MKSRSTKNIQDVLKNVTANKEPSVLVLFSTLNICRSVTSMTWKIFLHTILSEKRKKSLIGVRINSSKGIIIMEPHPNDEQKKKNFHFPTHWSLADPSLPSSILHLLMEIPWVQNAKWQLGRMSLTITQTVNTKWVEL